MRGKAANWIGAARVKLPLGCCGPLILAVWCAEFGAQTCAQFIGVDQPLQLLVVVLRHYNLINDWTSGVLGGMFISWRVNERLFACLMCSWIFSDLARRWKFIWRDWKERMPWRGCYRRTWKSASVKQCGCSLGRWSSTRVRDTCDDGCLNIERWLFHTVYRPWLCALTGEAVKMQLINGVDYEDIMYWLYFVQLFHFFLYIRRLNELREVEHSGYSALWSFSVGLIMEGRCYSTAHKLCTHETC